MYVLCVWCVCVCVSTEGNCCVFVCVCVCVSVSTEGICCVCGVCVCAYLSHAWVGGQKLRGHITLSLSRFLYLILSDFFFHQHIHSAHLFCISLYQSHSLSPFSPSVYLFHSLSLSLYLILSPSFSISRSPLLLSP